MRIDKQIIHVTAVVKRDLSEGLIAALKEAGFRYTNATAARKIQLLQNRGPLKLFLGDQSLSDDAVQTITFFINKESELPVLQYVIKHASLDIPGHGSVFSREVKLLSAHPECMENRLEKLPAEKADKALLAGLTGITCIVQKGEGNIVARTGLDTGSGVPVITYGEGTGLRDKLGLWRITIPAEKEIAQIVATASDAKNLMELMINVGGLDQPGKGFIYQFPVTHGLIDAQIHIGMASQAASIEQIVTVLDEFKRGTEWRRRDFGNVQTGRRYLTDLTDLTLICNEGHAMDLVKAAMAAGAAGATVSKLKYLALADAPECKISPAREKAEMIVGAGQVDAITDALIKAGALSDDKCGQVYLSPVPCACTYLGKAR
ncbi:MAG: hypothetical protein V1913_08755 [Fibrobacterota bacterium]